jgi:hypothetical protein
MIINRRTLVAKPGQSGKMKEMLIDLFESNPWPGGTVRIYTSHIGPFNHVVVEHESENLAVFEKQDAQFRQNFPAGIFDRFHELEASGYHEMWTLAYERRKD